MIKRAFFIILILANAFGWLSIKARADDPKPSEKSDSAVLAESWPDRPEWLDMYTDILQGSRLGPNDGWFRRAVAQVRFTWDATRGKYDRDSDGSISRAEFPGSDNDFARLDRTGDRQLTKADFDFTVSYQAPNPSLMLFNRLDKNSDGRVTREEFVAFFDQLGGGDSFLSVDDLQDKFKPPAQPSGGVVVGGAGQPTKETLVRALFRQELGSMQPGPSIGDAFRDFTLKTVDGREEITLSKLVGEKPVVLIFGNFTCGPFRRDSGSLEKLYLRYKDRATFLMVYVREAHPTDGWRMDSNDRSGVVLPQPRTYDDRVKIATTCARHLDLSFPLVIDTIDDGVGAYYSGMPSRLYLIDRSGKIAFKNARGPFGFKPAELEQSLILLLQEKFQNNNAKSSQSVSGREQ